MADKMISRSSAIAALYDVINNDMDGNTIPNLIETTSMLILEIQGIDAWGISTEQYKDLEDRKENVMAQRRLGSVPLCKEDAFLLRSIAI